ncbi:MFS family permease [Pseudonocardia eucalypti]|uniref:MFS transporter n=1 Tax=Pseudonocardia eucalypti TaxID=648755 RepID=UPI00181F5A88|nr:MFS family permease [Pseudonocardia eucalypti]
MSRSESPEPPLGGRAGWSSGGRRRKMWQRRDEPYDQERDPDREEPAPARRPPPRQPERPPGPRQPQPGHRAPGQPIAQPPPPRQPPLPGHSIPPHQRAGSAPRPSDELGAGGHGPRGTRVYGPFDGPADQSRDRGGGPAGPGEHTGRAGHSGHTGRGDSPREAPPEGDNRRSTPPPRKLTVTRVAAWRSRQLTEQGIRAFQRAAGADGADRSGLRALTYATMLNYANDAAIAVALANTLFFSAATAESKTKVALYLLITVAPFAIIAPVIGPLLDRIQRGRRVALAASFAGRAVLCVVMAFHFNDWGLYPAALGVMVLSKSFTVLRAAVTPRVLPRAITLVTTNSRLTAFGLIAGGVFGAFAAGFAKLTGSPGALVYTAALCVLGGYLCLRIPRWVEVTEGEVPAALRHADPTRPLRAIGPGRGGAGRAPRPKQPISRPVVVALWANSAIRVLTGFLMLFVAFAVKAETERDPTRQLVLLGLVGAAAGIGSFAGNAAGSRKLPARTDALLFGCLGAGLLGAVGAAVFPGIAAATVCALLASTGSALAKVCLDAVIQRDLPERSRASAFGRSETVLQLAWVTGGAAGVLLPPVYWIGFTVVAGLVALVGAQAVLISRGGSLLPWLRHREAM